MKIYFLDNKLINANIISYSTEKLPYYPASNIKISSTKSKWRTEGLQTMQEWISFDLASARAMEYFQALGSNISDYAWCYVEGADNSGFSSGLISQYISGKDLKAGKFFTSMSKRFFRLRILDGICFVGTSGGSVNCWDSCVVGNNIYVCSNHRISIFSVGDFSYINYFGSSGSGNGQFNNPYSICSDGTNLYVADYYNYRIQKFTLDGTYISKTGYQGSGNGQFNKPVCIRFYNGKLYIADTDNNRVQVHLASDLSYVETFPFGAVAVGCWIDEMNQYIIIGGINSVKIYKVSDKTLVGQVDSLPTSYSSIVQVGNYLYRGDFANNRIMQYSYPGLSYVGAYSQGSGSLPGQLNSPRNLNLWPERNLIMVANYGSPYYVVGITPELKFQSNPDGYIEIGKLNAAEKKTFERHVVTQFASKQDDKSLVIETENLVVFSVRKELLQHVAFTLQQLKTTDKQMLDNFISNYGLTRSFAVYIESENEGNYVLPNVKFSGMPQIETIAYDNYSVKIDLVEEK